MQPTEGQRPAVEAQEPAVLITARPGRGKTTVALLFARRVLQRDQPDAIKPSQHVLFLTFSRNAVYQIEQTSGRVLDVESRARIRISTYHSFMWWLIQAFGRYNGLPRRLGWMGATGERLCRRQAGGDQVGSYSLPEYAASSRGAISYGMFAPLALDLLRKSTTLRGLLHGLYPVVVVDEFQDTSDEQWEFVKLVSDGARLVCLADPDQMIFRFSGASVERLNQFIREQGAKRYEFGECLRTDDHELLDFAETILDNKPVARDVAQRHARRFLRGYNFATALGPWLKPIVTGFHSDYRKRRKGEGRPSIALAAHSNNWARKLRAMLGRATPSAPQVYYCGLIESDADDVLESLILNLMAWVASAEAAYLATALQLTVCMLPEGAVARNASLRSLLDSSGTTSSRLALKGLAKHMADGFSSIGNTAKTTPEDALRRAVDALRSLMAKSKAYAESVSDEAVEECCALIHRLLTEAPPGGVGATLEYLKNRLSSLRVRQCVLERVQPTRGLVSSTLHKLKGKEFDYVCIVTVANDTLRSQGETEQDARHLLYVALTRARYDARVLYSRNAPCSLLRPYLETVGQGPQKRVESVTPET